MRRLLPLLFVLMLCLPAIAQAQEATPESEPASMTWMMPTPSYFGDDWKWIGGYEPRATDDAAFVDGYGAYFGGPAGERAQVVIMNNKTSRSAITEGWDTVSGWIDNLEYDSHYDIEYSREDEMSELPLPDGVSDAVRVDGTAYFMGYPMCAGVYAIEPDLMLFVTIESRLLATRGSASGLNGCDNLAAYIASRSGR